jgi:hypothetical protein
VTYTSDKGKCPTQYSYNESTIVTNLWKNYTGKNYLQRSKISKETVGAKEANRNNKRIA